MKAYIINDKHSYEYDENKNRRYIEVATCEKCTTFRWDDAEKRAVTQAINHIFVMADFHRSIFQKVSGSCGRSDWRGIFDLHDINAPFRELFEYDSDQIGLLKGVMWAAGFSGVTEVDIKSLVKAYEIIRDLTWHIHENHRPAYISYFRQTYPKWVDAERIFRNLALTAGKSQAEMSEFFENEYNEAKCIYDDEQAGLTDKSSGTS